ncbi:hypothetical protein HTZ77_39810 [Nonomuraea sp. SMC257]|uniref:Uncharacterized protein n=1 Tax=Nonomuraea montanisoli TaxID=2741721 RepID=A0A7Y6M8L0_9ACTN|nr:hypothetical protein [Nonomuraea montanisoli]NUW37504.1 hypothetical protein [Nonomuraea montanisoli]
MTVAEVARTDACRVGPAFPVGLPKVARKDLCRGGLVFPVRPPKVVVEVACTDVCRGGLSLGRVNSGGRPCFDRAGRVEVAAPERRTELRHRMHGRAGTRGVEAELVATEQRAGLSLLVGG